VLKEGLVRADDLPLVFRALGADGMPRGARVRVRITGTDLLTLDVHASVLTRLDDAGTTADDASVEPDEGEDTAGPLALAIDVDDAAAGAEGTEVGKGDTAATPA
jgi:exoribonuclease-2